MLDDEPQRVNGKRRWAYGELTVADIVDAAARLARRVGVNRLTMRAVGEELGLSSMSIYYYVPNKGALLDLLIDCACSRVDIPAADAGSWDERLRVLMRNARSEFLLYPGLANLMQVRPVTPHARLLGEAADQLLEEGGFAKAETRRYALSSLINYLFGALGWESTLPSRTRNQPSREARDGPARSRQRDSAEEWTYRQTMLSLDDLFEYGLDMAIAGLCAKAEEEKSPRPRRSTSRAGRA